MNYFENNFSIFKKRFPSSSDAILSADDDGSVVPEISKKNSAVPAFLSDGKKFYLHSRFDPFTEAERLIAETSPDKHDILIVFGFGFGYHVAELLKKTPEERPVLVIETNPLIVKKAMESLDLTAIFSDERFSILLNPSDDDISLLLKGKSTKSVGFITHRGSYQTDPEKYSNLIELSRSYFSTKEVNIATLAKFEKVWTANISRNIRMMAQSPGANSFYGKFKGVPAIVVAAGPSLGKSIEFIKQNKNRAVIIAVDTAYKILQKNGIDPHFCIAVDPQTINARYFEGVKKGSTILLADPTVHPSVFRLFGGRSCVTGTAFEILKWIENITGTKGELTHGGSVSTNAYDFARRTSASPIILVGQDLAFTGGYAHAKGSYLDEQIHLRTTRLYTPEMFNRYQLTALPKLFVKGIKSPRVHTNQKMMIFSSWFERRNDNNIINATFDGAMIPGIKHSEHKSISFGSDIPDLDEMIGSIYNNNIPDEKTLSGKAEALSSTIDSMLREIDSLIPVISRAEAFSAELVTIMQKTKRDRSRLDFILTRLTEADKAVESKKTVKDMISITAQRVIHTINEGYDIDQADSKISNDELVAKRSHYLYRGLLEGAKQNKKSLGRMLRLIRKNN